MAEAHCINSAVNYFDPRLELRPGSTPLHSTPRADLHRLCDLTFLAHVTEEKRCASSSMKTKESEYEWKAILPLPSFSVSRPTRTDAPRLATPCKTHENSGVSFSRQAGMSKQRHLAAFRESGQALRRQPQRGRRWPAPKLIHAKP